MIPDRNGDQNARMGYIDDLLSHMRNGAMHLAFGLVALVFAVFVGAETEYKSVDAEGNVTYSDQLPSDAVRAKTIEAVPGPSAEEVSGAKKRAQAVEQAVEAAEDERATTAKPSAVTSIPQEGTDTETVWVDGPRRLHDPRGPIEPRDSEEPREVADAEPRKKVMDAEPRKKVP